LALRPRNITSALKLTPPVERFFAKNKERKKKRPTSFAVYAGRYIYKEVQCFISNYMMIKG
jgi:hypothetical protein